MGIHESRIECRTCGETLSPDSDACPHCGTSIRSSVALGAAIAVGIIVGVVSLLGPSGLLFFAAVGFGVALGAGVLFYDKRQRLRTS